MMEAGFLEKDEAGQLLDYPDLESITSLQNSPIQYAELVAENILEKGKYVPPDPHSNLLLNIKIGTYALLRGQLNNVPEERLDMMRQYISDANDLLDQGTIPEGVVPPEEAPLDPAAVNAQPSLGEADAAALPPEPQLGAQPA
jgi:hypothetical protein